MYIIELEKHEEEEYYHQGGKSLFVQISRKMPRGYSTKLWLFERRLQLSLIAMIIDKDSSFECTSRYNFFEESPELIHYKRI